jgi:hypothetical protein
MDARGYDWCAPRKNDPAVTEENAFPLTSGYVQRGRHLMAKQGSKRPWKLYQNYFLDLSLLRFGSVDDGNMEFGRAKTARRAA